MLSSVLWLSASARVTRRLNLLAYDSWRLAALNSVSYFVEMYTSQRDSSVGLKREKWNKKGDTKEIMGKERTDKKIMGKKRTNKKEIMGKERTNKKKE